MIGHRPFLGLSLWLYLWPFLSWSQPLPQDLTNLYQDYWSGVRPEEEKLIFFPEKLPEKYHLPAAVPSEWANTHLIWGENRQGQKVAAFRPVQTTTGCDSGCTPVVFHLVLDVQGRVEAILEDPENPLRKIHHQFLSREDKEKLLVIAQNLPEALRWVEKPKQLTNSLTQFPPQTWTAFQDTLIPGGAYTSFRVFEAALLTHQFLSLESPLRRKIQEDEKKAESLVSGQYSSLSLSQLRMILGQVSSLLESPSFSVEGKKILLSGGLNLLAPLVLQGDANDMKTIKKHLERKEYQNLFRYQYCEFLETMLRFPRGQRWLLERMKNPSEWPVCEPDLDRLFPLLAAAQLGDQETLRTLAREMEMGIIPAVIRDDPFFMEVYAQAAKLLGREEEFLKILSQIRVRFPLHNLDSVLNGLSGGQQERLQALFPSAEREYQQELYRGILETEVFLPEITGRRGSASVKIPLVSEKKQIYVFFASWCGHCRKTLARWVQSSRLTSAFWNKVALIEIFPKSPGPGPVQEFCQVTGLSVRYPEVCQNIVQLGSSAVTTQFYEKMSLTGVPRIIVTKASGQIGVFDYHLPQQEGTDFHRDLMWMVQGPLRP